ncbi:hypothetical protein MNBD_GAMMA02-1257 [hydrothermal vent metagenome]|uniref:Nudix hydrolase domain-containing protein n=1 Tax=hydrothermal vent metagenome TaxID=652676 RepID=A0A3B0WR23_9ZZZZ
MNNSLIRTKIYKEIESIKPFDEIEITDKSRTLEWIKEGAKIFRTKAPNIPPKHLVVYFVLIDTDSVLLVNHIAAQLWLPPGGHVEPNEHPLLSVRRECLEELNIEAEFLVEEPVLITDTETVGTTVKHTDVCLWYLLKGSKKQHLDYDQKEFIEVKWFKVDKLPLENCNPNLERLILKLKNNGLLKLQKQDNQQL